MRVGLVSGDGLAVSGLLTVFRNVLALGEREVAIEPPVHTELGFSWRPDKPGFFPHGDPGTVYPDWMTVTPGPAVDRGSEDALGAALTSVRDDVARYDSLNPSERKELLERVRALEKVYLKHFRHWLRDAQPDWVFALNMTLSDGVPATRALHGAAAEHFGTRRGGVVFWDHDLFRSCSIHDPGTGNRLYPVAPNPLTPVPQPLPYMRWVVVSEALADETTSYPTTLRPQVVPNTLPRVPAGPLERRHLEFAAQNDLDLRRPLLLDPVRVFQVKGVQISVELLARAKAAAEATGEPVPYLLVFGSLVEDPAYAESVQQLVAKRGLGGDVRWLDGVPLVTHREGEKWRLDEIDLLRLARATFGGVVFTPGVSDVETVGLGPALAAVADVPSAVTYYGAFRGIFSNKLDVVAVGPSDDQLSAAGRELVDVLAAFRRGSDSVAASLARNRAAVNSIFREEPWIETWRELEDSLKPLGPTKRRSAANAR